VDILSPEVEGTSVSFQTAIHADACCIFSSQIIWEVSGDLMEDYSTPLIDAVHHKLKEPSLDCKETFAYDPSKFNGYSMVAGIQKPVPPPQSVGNDMLEPKPLSCPTIYYWGWTQTSSCHGYFQCINGNVVTDSLSVCEEGTLFDEESSQCIDASRVNCSEQQQTVSNKEKDTNRPTKLSTRPPTPKPTLGEVYMLNTAVIVDAVTNHPTNRPTPRPSRLPTRKPNPPITPKPTNAAVSLAQPFANMASTFAQSISSPTAFSSVVTENPSSFAIIPIESPKNKGQEQVIISLKDQIEAKQGGRQNQKKTSGGRVKKKQSKRGKKKQSGRGKKKQSGRDKKKQSGRGKKKQGKKMKNPKARG
jgi:hypothetical protein